MSISPTQSHPSTTYMLSQGEYINNLSLLNACNRKNLATTRYLLSQSLKDLKNIKDIHGNTVFHFACNEAKEQDFELIIFLINENKELVNIGNNEGDTPLHLACAQGNLPLVELLVGKQAEINALNNAGDTPLHYAVKNGDLPVIQFLLENGAQAVPNNDGKTPVDLAKENKVNLVISKIPAKKRHFFKS